MQDKSIDLVLGKEISLKIPNVYLGLIILNRPKEMNSLSWAMVKNLKPVFENFSNRNDIRAIAFTGAGNAFSAGVICCLEDQN